LSLVSAYWSMQGLLRISSASLLKWHPHWVGARRPNEYAAELVIQVGALSCLVRGWGSWSARDLAWQSLASWSECHPCSHGDRRLGWCLGRRSPSDQNNSGTISKDDVVERQVLLSNPVLKTFGNARTFRSNKSSGFGNYLVFHNPRGQLLLAYETPVPGERHVGLHWYCTHARPPTTRIRPCVSDSRTWSSRVTAETAEKKGHRSRRPT
jgi:hypothetical protein